MAEKIVDVYRSHEGEKVVVIIKGAMVPNPETGKMQYISSVGTLTRVLEDGIVVRETEGEVVYGYDEVRLMFPSSILPSAILPPPGGAR